MWGEERCCVVDFDEQINKFDQTNKNLVGKFLHDFLLHGGGQVVRYSGTSRGPHLARHDGHFVPTQLQRQEREREKERRNIIHT